MNLTYSKVFGFNSIFAWIYFFSFTISNTSAQTTLAPGDVAVIFVQGDNPDAFGFVPFVDLAEGTLIYFTDCGADAAGFSMPCTEGAVLYTTPVGGITAGTYIKWVRFAGTPNFSDYNDTRITGTTGPNLSFAGDQILVFQDTDGLGGLAAAENPIFIFAVNTASNTFNGDKTDSNQTGLPSGLSESTPVTAMGLGSGSGAEDEYDNIIYDGSEGYTFSTIAEMKAAFTDKSNYLGNDTPDAAYNTLVANLDSPPLPVELTSFTAKQKEESILLNWQTASEVNNDFFQIEFSTNGHHFITLDKVAGLGNSKEIMNYSYAHVAPPSGINYYRLKQVDFDGAFEFSKIVTVDFKKSNNEFSIFPNPFDETLTISFNSQGDAYSFAKDRTINVYDVHHRKVQSFPISKNEIKTILDLSMLNNGIYFLRIDDGHRATSLIKRILKF